MTIFGELEVKVETDANAKWAVPWRVLIRSRAGVASAVFCTEAEARAFVTGFRLAAEKADAYLEAVA